MKLGMSAYKRNLSVFCGVVMGCLLAASGAQAETLTYSSYLSPTAPLSKGVAAFTDMAQKKTDGKIKFQVYYSGTLASGKTTLSGLTNGLFDGGGIVSVYTPSSLPTNMVMSDLPFLNEDVRVTAAAVTDTTLNDCPQCLEEYKKLNVHFLSSMATSPFHAMCKGKFENGFDPTGLRMRTPGEELGRWIKYIGAVPIQFANSEVYQAVQRNALDCGIGSLVWLHTLSWQEIANTVVNMPMGGYLGGSLINLSQNTWNKLDKSEQRAMEEAAMYGTAAMTYVFVDGTKTAVKTAKDKYHVQFVDASPKLIAERKAFLKTELTNAATKAEGRGVKNPQLIVAAFQKNMKKWQKLIGDKDLTQEQYAQLLIDNILK